MSIFVKLRTWWSGERIIERNGYFIPQVKTVSGWKGVDATGTHWSGSSAQYAYCKVDTFEQAKDRFIKIYDVPKPEPLFWRTLKNVEEIKND